jgi:mRNA interferase MazF
LSTVTVAPVTSTIRGVPSEVQLGIDDGMKRVCAALHNAVTVGQRPIGRRLAGLSERRMEDVCAALAFAVGCSG